MFSVASSYSAGCQEREKLGVRRRCEAHGLQPADESPEYPGRPLRQFRRGSRRLVLWCWRIPVDATGPGRSAHLLVDQAEVLAALHVFPLLMRALSAVTISQVLYYFTLALEEHREEITMSNEHEAPEQKGVAVKVLTTVDLGPEIEGMAGRQLRMRMVTIEPGGVFGPIHDHKDRPGTVYILQGTITDHRNGVATDYGPGVGWPDSGTCQSVHRSLYHARTASTGLPPCDGSKVVAIDSTLVI
jgi:hypothetical protein